MTYNHQTWQNFLLYRDLNTVLSFVPMTFMSWSSELASVAQLDTPWTGDKVAGSIPVGSAIFFCVDLIMKYFLWSFSPF